MLTAISIQCNYDYQITTVPENKILFYIKHQKNVRDENWRRLGKEVYHQPIPVFVYRVLNRKRLQNLIIQIFQVVLDEYLKKWKLLLKMHRFQF